MTPEPALTPKRAVAVGQLVVNLPVAVIIVLACVASAFLGPSKALVCLPVGFGLAWLWWSATVPRWREWAKNKGADPEQTQDLAQTARLVWPKGHFLERTEFRLRKRE
jgi:hypothetical protein